MSGHTVAATVVPDPPKACSSCDEWNIPHEPFQVFGNTYYVGTAGLSSILVTSKRGLILIDGGLSQSAPLIADSIRKLGYRIEDVRLILNSHTHHDHAGGLAALQRASGAIVAASPASALALKQGGPTSDDPQFAFGREINGFPSIAKVKVVADDETLRVGDLEIRARFTPGHTPGGTSWTWRSCEGTRCLDMVYADSLNAVSAPGFNFASDSSAFGDSIARVAQLRCDVLMAPHPGQFDMETKFQSRRHRPPRNPFIDPKGCESYAAAAKLKLEKRIEDDRASK